MSGNKLDVSKVPKDASSVPEDQVRQLADHSSQMGGMAGMSGMNHHSMMRISGSKSNPDEYEAILDELEKASKLRTLLHKYSHVRDTLKRFHRFTVVK